MTLGFHVATDHCYGCKTCTVACANEHLLNPGVLLRRVRQIDVSEPVGHAFVSMGCNHCDEPACVDVCPTGASMKREEDGIVTIDWETCIGCKTCITACPYDGVRTYVDGEPSYFLDFAVGDASIPAHKANVVEKCTFCVHRVDRGERPACVDICRAMARFWGDLDDPGSDVSKLLAEREYDQLLAESGTGPNVYLLKA